LNRGTVELIDSAGGQVIGGNLATTTIMVGGSTGPLLKNSSGTIQVRNNADSAFSNVIANRIDANQSVVTPFLYLGSSGGPMLRDNAGTIEARNNANSAASNFNCATLQTNTIQRAVGTATVTLFGGLVASPIFAVTIPGASNTLQNSSGIAGELALVAVVNQTGTAGSTNLLINRTETALGSGVHSFLNCQVASTTRFRIANSGAVQIGASGTLVTSIISATATLDFPSIAADSFADLTITVTGAVSGDTVVANPIAGSAITDVIYDAWVSAANTVTIRAINNSSTVARDPASGTFRATVIRF
jgi:hypothetical protein